MGKSVYWLLLLVIARLLSQIVANRVAALWFAASQVLEVENWLKNFYFVVNVAVLGLWIDCVLLALPQMLRIDGEQRTQERLPGANKLFFDFAIAVANDVFEVKVMIVSFHL